jgi:hypothetical protein
MWLLGMTAVNAQREYEPNYPFATVGIVLALFGGMVCVAALVLQRLGPRR